MSVLSPHASSNPSVAGTHTSGFNRRRGLPQNLNQQIVLSPLQRSILNQRNALQKNATSTREWHRISSS